MTDKTPQELPSEQEIAEALSVVLDEARSYSPTASGACESCEHPNCKDKRDWAVSLYNAERLLDKCPRLVAVKENEHVYVSKFKPGSDMFIVEKHHDKEWRVRKDTGADSVLFSRGQVYISPEGIGFASGPRDIDCWDNEDDCFPTKELAEQEAARRNQGGKA